MGGIESLFRGEDTGVEPPKIQKRTGKYSIIIPERCNHYAEFMNHLSREECDAIFWLLLLTIVILLGVVVYLTQRAHGIAQLQPDAEKGLDIETLAHKNLKIRRKLFAVSLVCFLLAVTATIMAAFAGLAIAWCHGEDLINFYWSFWTIIANGSVIAIFGTVLQQWYSLSDGGISQPAWNFALGTPIPVMATIMHCLGFKSKKAWKSYRNKRRERKEERRGRSDGSMSSRSISKTAGSASKLSLSTAKFLSFTPDGKCILEIEMSPEALQNMPCPYPYQSNHHSATSSNPSEDLDPRELATPRYFPFAASGSPETSQLRYEDEYQDMRVEPRQASVVDPDTDALASRMRFILPNFKREDSVPSTTRTEDWEVRR